MTASLKLAALNQLSEDQFVTLLGGIFEHSPWVAQKVAAQRPFASTGALHQAMVAVIEAAGREAQLTLIRAHPELAGKAAVRGQLTAESTSEQAGAGLNQCSPEEFARLTGLNRAYNEKFGFPFILAVRGHDRASILRIFAQRLENDVAQEIAECLAQIYKIGQLRLAERVDDR